MTGPVAGDVIGQQTTVHGVPFDEYKQIRDELGVTDEALASFFAIVERERVPRHELEPALKEIAGRYKELLARLGTTGSTDPEVQRLKEQAREALRVGDFARAEEFLNQAKARDLSAIERMEADLDARKLSAAAAAAQNGDLMMTQIRYADAARYYAEAVELTPETRADQLSEHLRGWTGLRGVLAISCGLAAAERALTIDQGRLPVADILLATDLNNLALGVLAAAQQVATLFPAHSPCRPDTEGSSPLRRESSCLSASHGAICSPRPATIPTSQCFQSSRPRMAPKCATWIRLSAGQGLTCISARIRSSACLLG